MPQLVALVNADYHDFVSISTQLEKFDNGLTSLTHPLMRLRSKAIDVQATTVGVPLPCLAPTHPAPGRGCGQSLCASQVS